MISIQTSYPSSHDCALFHEGNLVHSYRLFGAHFVEDGGQWGVRFCVWAPHAQEIRVVGSFNDWSGQHHHMYRLDSGIWTLFVLGLSEGTLYKYEIVSHHGEIFLKADPYAFYSEVRPQTASVVVSLEGYEWQDQEWRQYQARNESYHRPMSIYEVHVGSWKVKADGTFYTYDELADECIDYAVRMGYTHIELLPLMEHPFDRSWGYQITGYFALTSRYGTPKQFKRFVDRCHQHGLGVIMDWVPGHFCKDAHGLRLFDGTPLYEYADSRKADKADWGTLSFDYGKPEVVNFLISNALFWMDQYHIDGLRVDAVASMLYLNFGRRDGDWLINAYGGGENLEAIAFMKKLNQTVFIYFPHALMMAEDSTDWPLVCTPVDKGGLGFNYKWNMGWMNDMLRYMQLDPYFRKWHHHLLTFSFMYAFAENYVLPLSHDEVVHGKKSLLDKMPGDYWQKFANLRLLLSYMMAHPGKKLLFMGGEFGQFAEWKDLEGDQQDWHLLDYEFHAKMHRYVQEMNHYYQSDRALWQLDHQVAGFEWIEADNYQQSIVVFMRKAIQADEFSVIVCNFTPVVYTGYRIGVPMPLEYTEVFNSDLDIYGGAGHKNERIQLAECVPWHNQPYSISITVPPLSTVIFKRIT